MVLLFQGWVKICFNPYRVFSGLATSYLCLASPQPPIVSIPIGFSQALQLDDVPVLLYQRVEFQSLSGFLRPCNFVNCCIELNHILSFNPYRVFSGLATQATLFGQLDSLNGFNPYRVFSGLATLLVEIEFASMLSFNPYRVFSGLATARNGRSGSFSS